MYSDSLDKIFISYFHAVSKYGFEYKNIPFKAKPLCINTQILRRYTCPEMCGACCLVFSLDYLPEEDKPKHVVTRDVVFNNSTFNIFSDLQKSNKGVKCQYLNNKGRCKIHGKHPFSCDFELIKAMNFTTERPNNLTTKLFTRGWNMTRFDGKKRAICNVLTITDASIADTYRKIERLEMWCQYFKIESWCPSILKWIESGNFTNKDLIFKR